MQERKVILMKKPAEVRGHLPGVEPAPYARPAGLDPYDLQALGGLRDALGREAPMSPMDATRRSGVDLPPWGAASPDDYAACRIDAGAKRLRLLGVQAVMNVTGHGTEKAHGWDFDPRALAALIVERTAMSCAFMDGMAEDLCRVHDALQQCRSREEARGLIDRAVLLNAVLLGAGLAMNACALPGTACIREVANLLVQSGMATIDLPHIVRDEVDRFSRWSRLIPQLGSSRRHVAYPELDPLADYMWGVHKGSVAHALSPLSLEVML